MNPMYQSLIGELIGLARATEGNEHLITEDSTAVITASLAANASDEDNLSDLIRKVTEVKRAMVPDCFLCACPCGRTSAYDLSRIDLEDQSIREMKHRILRELEETACSKSGCASEATLYHGLIALGLEGFPADELYRIYKAE